MAVKSHVMKQYDEQLGPSCDATWVGVISVII